MKERQWPRAWQNRECTHPTVYPWLPPHVEKRNAQCRLAFSVAVGLKEAVKVQRREQESLL